MMTRIIFAILLIPTLAFAGGVSDRAGNFKVDEALSLVGSAKVTDHIGIRGADLGTGTTAPTIVTVGNYTGWSYDINDDSVFDIDLDHSVDTTQNVQLHISSYIDEAYATNNGEVQWRAAWSACPKDSTEAIDAPTHSGTADTADINIP